MDMDPELHSRWLPDGRFQLTLGECLPVIVRPGTFFANTASELACLVGELTLVAEFLNKHPDVDLPLQTGQFTETATEFVLEDQEGTGRYDKMRVPRSFVFPEPE